MSIKAIRDSGLIVPKDVTFDYTDPTTSGVTKFTAREVPFTTAQMNGLKVAGGFDAFALLIASSITDDESGQFNYDEVLRLPKDLARELLLKAIEANKPEDPKTGAEGDTGKN